MPHFSSACAKIEVLMRKAKRMNVFLWIKPLSPPIILTFCIFTSLRMRYIRPQIQINGKKRMINCKLQSVKAISKYIQLFQIEI